MKIDKYIERINKEIEKLPETNKFCSYGNVDMNDLDEAIERLGKIPNLSDMLKDNNRINKQKEKSEEIIRNSIEYIEDCKEKLLYDEEEYFLDNYEIEELQRILNDGKPYESKNQHNKQPFIEKIKSQKNHIIKLENQINSIEECLWDESLDIKELKEKIKQIINGKFDYIE